MRGLLVKNLVMVILVMAVGLTIGCESADNGQSQIGTTMVTAAIDPKLKIGLSSDSVSSLTEKPTDIGVIQRINLFVRQVELKVSRNGGDEKKVILNLYQNQQVNLLDLAESFKLDLAQIQTRDGLSIHQIRLILEDRENYLQFADGEICELATPSQQESGLKIIFPNKLELKSNREYEVKLKLNLRHALVFNGNGGCSLKPVIKAGITESSSGEESNGEEGNEEVVVEPTPTPDPTAEPEPEVTPDPIVVEEPIFNPGDDVCAQSMTREIVIDPVTGVEYWVCF